MSVSRMHEGEVETNVDLVRRLLAAQFPEWADLSIMPVPSSGTDNALYRLGDELAVRLPRIDWATEQPAMEYEWLPRLAPQLPLAIPLPLALGAPGEGYPWTWSVCQWLEGENATPDRIADARQMATDLAGFVAALQRIDATGGPASSRGVPLATRDAATRSAIAALEEELNTDAVTATWEAALDAPVWDGPPVWTHGDLQSGNLLAVDGRLSAVIDFGCLGTGDPACDMIAAWTLFTAESRAVYRAALAVDDATWARGKGWALSTSLIAIPYYTVTNPFLANLGRSTIAAVLADG